MATTPKPEPRKRHLFVTVGVGSGFALWHPEWQDGDEHLAAVRAPFYGKRADGTTDKVWAAHKVAIAAPLEAEQRPIIAAIDAAAATDTVIIVIAHKRAFGGKATFPLIALAGEFRETLEPLAHYGRIRLEWVGSAKA